VAATIGRHELLSLAPEDPDRSIRRFRLGATDVEVKPDAPWARVPAWLPGPADQWAGGTRHAIMVRLAPPPSQTLLLDVLTRRTRPYELGVFPAPPVASRADLEIVVNGTAVATFTVPEPGAAPHAASHGSRRLHAIISAAVLGARTPATLALLNSEGHGVGIEHLRLMEARPSWSVSHLRHTGRLPVATAGLLLVGLGLLLWGRIRRPDGWQPRAGRRAAGPALGLLLLGASVAAPAVTRGLPHWVWLGLILCVLPLGRRPLPAAPGRRRPAILLARALGTLALALGALVISVVIGELALRVAFRDEPWTWSALHRPRPAVPNAPRPNSLGFDEREFPLDKPPSVYRIAVLGDSLSVSAPRPERFGSVIADRLNARAGGAVAYEALNFGRTGIDTEEETDILRQFVWRAHPDFVLLEWYVNDLENGDYSERPEMPDPVSADTVLGAWLYRLTDRTLLRWMLREEYQAALENLGLLETYPAYMHRFFAEPASPRWPIADRALRAFIQECRAHHTPVAIALFPHLSAGLPAGGYEFAELHDQVLDLCRQEGVPCVDLRATFAARRDYVSLWVHRFDAHPNGLAHRLAAERLLEELGPLWIAAGRGSS
jgi:hypothetical protein